LRPCKGSLFERIKKPQILTKCGIPDKKFMTYHCEDSESEVEINYDELDAYYNLSDNFSEDYLSEDYSSDYYLSDYVEE
jgi:hypothetical protein